MDRSRLKPPFSSTAQKKNVNTLLFCQAFLSPGATVVFLGEAHGEVGKADWTSNAKLMLGRGKQKAGHPTGMGDRGGRRSLLCR